MRLFIAIDLPQTIKNNLKDSQLKLKKYFRQARFTREDNFHVTLKFLGEVPSPQIGEIRYNLKQATDNIRAFEMSIGGLGKFGNTFPYRVIWAGISGDMDVLENLQHQVDTILEPLGFAREKRQFHPHITLARDVEPINEVWKQISIGENNKFTVTSFSLVESVIESGRRIYRVVETYRIN